ncbi:hypothetical protein CEQ90_06555 [Lewinellaceae bacterium SD302]|nr:hypothetical protein CEQ90_06555 [Lewinellaceae bacterium SD302]
MQLTHSQQLVLTGQQIFPDSPVNNMAFAYHWRGEVNGDLLYRSLRKTLAASESSRLRITEDGFRISETEITVNRLIFTQETDPSAAADAYVLDDCRQPFALDGPLCTASLLEVTPEHFIVYLNQHHLITDGWGKAIQFDYLYATYRAAMGSGPLPEPLAKFSDYAKERAEAKIAEPQARLEAQKHWRQKLEALPTPAPIYGHLNPTLASQSVRIKVSLSTSQTKALAELIERPEFRSWSRELSCFNVFATTLFAWLSRSSGHRHLSIGTPAHNRLSPGHRRTPGLFIELFPLVIDLESAETFSSLYQKVSAECMSFLRQAKPGSSVIELGKGFNVLLNFISQPLVPADASGHSAEWLHNGHSEPAHHLRLQIFDFNRAGRFTLAFDLNESVFPAQFRQLAVDQFLELLDNFLAVPEDSVFAPTPMDLGRLAGQEPERVNYPDDQSLVDLFNKAAKQYADYPAIELDGGGKMSYAELDERSDQLADHLYRLGVRRETLVAVCLERSLDMSVALLGILKAGGAYVPIDPEYPAGRIEAIVSEAEIKLVVGTSDHASHFANFPQIQHCWLDREQRNILSADPRPVNTLPKAGDLIYTIYTSGSTGRPKGVMNQHRGVLNRLLWGQDTFQLKAGQDVVLQKTNYCFDVSVWELFWPLLSGAKLLFARPGGHKDNRYLEEVIGRGKVSVIHFVPPMLDTFLDGNPKSAHLTKVFCSGEALRSSTVSRFRQLMPGVELHNLYGPTEAGIEVTHWQMPTQGIIPASIPIGRPTANNQLYVLDEHDRPVTQGARGLLHIGGVQLAKGYHARPELTAEKFKMVTIPGYSAKVRLYDTGDAARWLPNGELEYLGRVDNQIKLRGFRIELGEIEYQLLAVDSVLQAVVLVLETEQVKKLVAFLRVNAQYDESEVRSSLQQSLPNYMLPVQYVLLDSFPLTPNGKIDRNELLASDVGQEVGKGGKADSVFEEMVIAEYAKLFQTEKLGVEDNFFSLGGDSLMAIKLTNRLQEAFELELSPAVVFRHPTPQTLAAHLESTIRRLLAEMEDEV